MIDYSPLWKTLEEKGLSGTKLTTVYGISSSTINKLRHNQHVSTATIQHLCEILMCDMTKIVIINGQK